ncbi:MAG: DUF2059 domain-containing protein [Pseudomonadota bacterium]
MNRSTLIAICFAVSFVGHLAHAQTKLEKAERISRLAITEATLGDMAARAGQSLASQIEQGLQAKGKTLPANEKTMLIRRFSSAMIGLMRLMEPETARIYAEEFTERELDLLLRIYDDPEMANLMAKLPVVMDRLTPFIQRESISMATQVIADMKAEGFLSDL